MKNILLLTSTIKPNAIQPGLILTNPLDRLEDYRKAMHFYSKALNDGIIDGIIFVDNSGFDLKCISDDFTSPDIEWMSFYGLDYPPSYHRGYGEFKLIDYAFSKSTKLAGLNESDIVWKITGRYIVKNLKSVISYTPRKFDLYCDIKNTWIDMGVMAWSIRGYECFIRGISEKFKTDMVPELIMSQFIIEQAKFSKDIFTNLYWMPLIIGRRGFDGGQFQGKFTFLKFLLISCVNWVMLPFRRILSFTMRKIGI